MTVARATRRYAGYVFDLDGTLYLDEELMPGAAATLAWVRRVGARVAFVTNNPLQAGQAYAAKLSRLGIEAAADEVVTSLDALVGYLRAAPPAGPVLAIAEPLVTEVLREAGFAVTQRAEDAALVVVSWDRTFDYAKLVLAFRALRAGARLVATNPDPFCPTADGGLPDCAAMLAAVEACSGQLAETTVGKPSGHMAETILARLRAPAAESIVIGDRLLTDMRLAHTTGATAALVLSGVTSAADIADATFEPHLVLGSLLDLIPDHDPLATEEARP